MAVGMPLCATVDDELLVRHRPQRHLAPTVGDRRTRCLLHAPNRYHGTVLPVSGAPGAGGFYPIRCVRTADWKLSINLLDTDELYDLHADPGETVNLIAAAEHATVRNELHDLLLAHLEETNDLLAGPGWARRPWRGGAATPPFEGFFTTGYRDAWPSGSFFTW